MDFKKILILGVLLVVVLSAAGAVSAGWFDFGDEEQSFTVHGRLIDGSANTTLWEDNVGNYSYDRDLSCDIEVPATEEQWDRILNYEGPNDYCKITYGNGSSEVFRASDTSLFEWSIEEDNVIHIEATNSVYSPVKFENTHCGIS